MKTLHYSIIVILVTSLIVVNNPVFADNTTSTSYGGLTGFRQAYFQGNHGSYPIWYKLTNGTAVSTLLDLPSKALLFMIKASSDGQLIVELPRTIIDSKNQNADKPYFVGVGGVTTGLSQVNATETSDDYLRTLKIGFTKNTDEIEIVGTFFVENYSSMTKHSSVLLSPLKQFKSGISAQDVTCRQGLWLIFKTSDDSPACVKPDAAYALIHRGWANEISKTSLHTVSPASSTSCDTPYPKSDVGVAVLYMPHNSTGKICATYPNSKSPIQAGIRVFAGRDMQQQASEIIASVYPDMLPTGNSTIVYTLKTGNQAGLYGISFFCGGVPFAVGYDTQSRIVLDDFPWLDKEYQCLYQSSIFQITGLSGIHVKYVTAVYRDQLDN